MACARFHEMHAQKIQKLFVRLEDFELRRLHSEFVLRFRRSRGLQASRNTPPAATCLSPTSRRTMHSRAKPMVLVATSPTYQKSDDKGLKIITMMKRTGKIVCKTK